MWHTIMFIPSRFHFSLNLTPLLLFRHISELFVMCFKCACNYLFPWNFKLYLNICKSILQPIYICVRNLWSMKIIVLKLWRIPLCMCVGFECL